MPLEKLEINDIAHQLKKVYGINKNISSSLNQQQQEELFSLLENNQTVLSLTQLFVAKNNELANNNRKYGKQTG